MNAKGNHVELQTFIKYGKSEIICFKTTRESGKTLVNFIWCKVCERNKDAILKDPSIKGKVKELARAYIDGTNMVKNTKYVFWFRFFFAFVKVIIISSKNALGIIVHFGIIFYFIFAD